MIPSPSPARLIHRSGSITPIARPLSDAHWKRLGMERKLARYRKVISHRDDRLFREFLPQGYDLMALSEVPVRFRERLLACKLHLGMFITLLDDFADHPRMVNPRLLKELHRTPFQREWVSLEGLSDGEKEVVSLAKELSDGALKGLAVLPHYSTLAPLLQFDVEQFLNANTFSSLMTRLPDLANRWECSVYGPHNMGMIAIGTMDLMATPAFDTTELGLARELLALGQRVGRICNLLVTLERELTEGDVTSEVIASALQARGPKALPPEISDPLFVPLIRELEQERAEIYESLAAYGDILNSFSVPRYLESLRGLHRLHDGMRGVI